LSVESANNPSGGDFFDPDELHPAASNAANIAIAAIFPLRRFNMLSPKQEPWRIVQKIVVSATWRSKTASLSQPPRCQNNQITISPYLSMIYGSLCRGPINYLDFFSPSSDNCWLCPVTG
jgi:hypothetical protein